MNIYDPIAEALGIHPTIDISEYNSLADESQLSSYNSTHIPVKWTEDMRKDCGDRQRQLISTGDHYFCKNTERNSAKLKDGTHPFLDKEAQRERAKRPRKRSPKIYVAEANRERIAKGKHIQVSIVTCPHCGKSGNYMIMRRWHFDNCKNYSSSSSGLSIP